MLHKRVQFLFLNVGHFLDHLFMLIFASVAAMTLTREWGLSYAELIPYATPGFVAFGVCALFAGWIADKWSREGMMVVFFVGIGSSAVLTSLASEPLQIALGLLLVGIFAAIYHPVGLAMVVHGRKKTGVPLAINGIFGNMGVACAALFTGVLVDIWGWRSAFVVPGTISIAVGVAFILFLRDGKNGGYESVKADFVGDKSEMRTAPKNVLLLIFSIVIFTTAIGGLIFQSTTFSLPKVFEEEVSGSATLLGWYSFMVFSIAALAQLAVGYLVDHYSVRLVFAVVAFLQALLFMVMTQISGMLTVVVAVLFMLAVFGQIPINDVLVGRVTHSEWRSRAYAIRYVVTFTVMASTVPLIAWIHGTWGFDRLFSLLAVAATAIFIAVMFLPGVKSTAHPHIAHVK